MSPNAEPPDRDGDPEFRDSEGYRGDSAGYQVEQEPDAPEQTPDEDWGGPDSDGYFYESDRYGANRKIRLDGPVDPNGGWMPGPVEEALDVRGLRPGRREWQVNIRLERERYAVLRKAADLYGTTPTAMARQLVNRGADSIVKAHWAEMKALNAPDPKG